jgi:hypothetical protein
MSTQSCNNLVIPPMEERPDLFPLSKKKLIYINSGCKIAFRTQASEDKREG